jgi:serine O-acetyltransferase
VSVGIPGSSPSVLAALRRDLARSLELNTDADEPRWLRAVRLPFHFGTQAVVVHRLGEWAEAVPIPGLRHALLVAYGVAKYVVQIVTGVCLAHRTRIGPGLVVHTGSGVFIGPRRMGRDCYVQHGVVISYAVEEIGDNVYFGPGAKVHGHIRIGNNVHVGANAVLARSVPDNCTALGNPARIIPKSIYREPLPVGELDGRPAADPLPRGVEA